jgi:glycosyltransferase involved in cell wall biosynthesis
VALPVPLRSGGLGTAAGEFVDGLSALGVETTCVGPGKLGPAARIAASPPFRRAFGAGLARSLGGRAVRRAVPAGGWDLAYAVAGSLPVGRGPGVRILHQATRYPAIERAALRRAERETGGRGDLSRAEVRRSEHEIERADLIHVTTRAVREEFLEAGIAPERLVYSPLGVDLERFRPGPRRPRTTIAFVGPLSLRKGVDVVAELAERVGEDAVVETVGGPSCPWSRRISAGARFVRRASVAEMLGAAHVFVLPSRSDGFSYAVLEALASGTPPIVTPEVGAAEIVRRLDEQLVVERESFVERTLELLPRLDLADLAARAVALAAEFDRRRTSRAAASAVLERCDGLELG